MKKYKFIPYNKNLVLRARELRLKPTEAEKIFWSKILKSKEFSRYTFLRQKPIGYFIADFYCSKLKLVIEIDGDVHGFQKIRDKERDNLLEQQFGFKIIRYKNEEVINNTEKIIENLVKQLKMQSSPDSPLSGRGEW